jgi:hypothetical protein
MRSTTGAAPQSSGSREKSRQIDASVMPFPRYQSFAFNRIDEANVRENLDASRPIAGTTRTSIRDIGSNATDNNG